MDQGFNDDELADIMNEIETLEQEFNEDSKPEASQNDDVHQDLAEKSEEEIASVHKHAHDDKNIHQIQSSYKEGPNTSMDFSVEGDMKMNLFFNIGGKSVHLHISEGNFEIELEGGVKFSIPVDADSEDKAA